MLYLYAQVIRNGKKLDAGNSTECITHAGQLIAWNVFALCDPVTLTFDLLASY